MNVYLDNNIIVDVESRGLSIVNLTMKGIQYYYSSAHIEELIEGENVGVNVQQRLSTIDKISSSNCIDGLCKPVFCKIGPYKLYAQCKQPNPFYIKKLLNNCVSNFDVDRDKFTGLLDWRKDEVSNIDSCDILNKLNAKMYGKLDISLPDYIQITGAIGRSLYITLFNILDFVCFHKDKRGDHVNIARLYDASHAYYASICDIFVSRDKRMRYKTKAVYHYLNVDTKVMDLNEYFNFVTNKQ